MLGEQTPNSDPSGNYYADSSPIRREKTLLYHAPARLALATAEVAAAERRAGTHTKS
jgi:hypothetical protein